MSDYVVSDTSHVMMQRIGKHAKVRVETKLTVFGLVYGHVPIVKSRYSVLTRAYPFDVKADGY